MWCQIRRLRPSHSTGRPVYYPLWECTALPNLTRWPLTLRSQCRYVVPDSQVSAQSQHWQASVLTTAGTFSMSQPHAFLLMSHSRPVGQAIAREAKGTLPFVSSTFRSCLGSHLTAAVPPSATGPYNRPAPKPSGIPQRPSAVGKPLQLGALQIGKPLRLPASHSTGRPVYYPPGSLNYIQSAIPLHYHVHVHY
jgi:hypothetical protein